MFSFLYFTLSIINMGVFVNKFEVMTVGGSVVKPMSVTVVRHIFVIPKRAVVVSEFD